MRVSPFLNERQTVANQVEALFKNKLKSELDVSFAQVALGEAQLLQEKAAGDVEAGEASLSAALGYHEQDHFELVDPDFFSTLPGDTNGYSNTAIIEFGCGCAFAEPVDAACVTAGN